MARKLSVGPTLYGVGQPFGRGMDNIRQPGRRERGKRGIEDERNGRVVRSVEGKGTDWVSRLDGADATELRDGICRWGGGELTDSTD